MEISTASNSAGLKQYEPLDKRLGKDDFLKLFTSQLKYQDPLKPLEGTEFTAQMAQFSSLEQLFNLNSSMEQLVAYQMSLNNGFATSLISKTVKTTDDAVSKVTGVAFQEGITYLLLENGKRVTLGEIKEING
jgi:flagellar basal-body rod modification protein FlgD